MKNNKKIISFMVFIFCLFLTVGNLPAQSGIDSTGSGNATGQDKTSTGQTNGNSDYQQNQSNSGNQDEGAFQMTAQQLASDLVTRLNLGQDKAKDITDILVDYRNNIADAEKDNKSSSDQTGIPGNGPGTNDRSGMNNGNDNGNMTGSNNSDYMKSLQKADKDANDKIESAIGKENVAQYINIKKDWWRDVKDRVYASVNNNESSNSGSDMDNSATGSGKKGSRRGTGTNSGTGMGSGTNSGTGTDMGTGSHRKGTGSNKGTGTSTDTSGNRSSY